MPKTVLTPKTLNFQPRPAYPYSPGTIAGGFVFTAGQVAWNAKGDVVGIGDVRAQTRQALPAGPEMLVEFEAVAHV